MPREKKQHLKKRKDGYYVCRYKDQWFYSLDEDEALEQQKEYKRLEKERIGRIPTVSEYAEKWIRRAYPTASPYTMAGLRIHFCKLTDALGGTFVSDVRPRSRRFRPVRANRY